MIEIINAVYEGDGLVRLEQELTGIKPQERVMIFVLPAPVFKEPPIQKGDIEALNQQLQTFEIRYSLKTSAFYPRFMRGEMGDNRDFIVWAGLQELLQCMTTTS